MDINWESFIEKKEIPPWLPNIEESNFDPEYTSLPLDFSQQDVNLLNSVSK